jgi:hypothetical protein
MISKELIILILIIIILFLINKENFTGFRKDGLGTEIENKNNLFPYIPKNFFVNHFLAPKKRNHHNK